MSYDFTTLVDRSELNSEKWSMMHQLNPDLKKGVAPFSVADMDFKHPPEFVQGMKDYMDKIVLGYSMPGEDYYDAVINWMRIRHNWNIKKEWIVITGGIIPAIFNIVQTFTEEKDGIIVLSPIYYPFYNAIEKNHRKIIASEFDNSSGEYKINYDDLEKKAKDPNNKMILFCSPHNPVGRVWTGEEIERVGRICLDNDIKIVSDEVHFDLTMPGYKHNVFASVSDDFNDNIITCTAPSKSFNLAGMQTSNIIIADKETRKQFRNKLGQNGHEVWNPLGFEACRLSYTLCDGWLNELILQIYKNYSVLKEYLERNLPEVKLYPLEGTYLAWMDFGYLGLSHEELENLMIYKAQVFFDEGYIFGENGKGFERMNIACPTDVMLKALERIKDSICSL